MEKHHFELKNWIRTAVKILLWKIKTFIEYYWFFHPSVQFYFGSPLLVLKHSFQYTFIRSNQEAHTNYPHQQLESRKKEINHPPRHPGWLANDDLEKFLSSESSLMITLNLSSRLIFLPCHSLPNKMKRRKSILDAVKKTNTSEKISYIHQQLITSGKTGEA